MNRTAAALVAAALAFPACAAELPARPEGYVSDLAGILDGGTRDELESLAQDLERRATVELAVVTVKSLEGMTVEQYAVTLFKAWGIGKKDKNNGVLLIVAPADHKVRIEVGYGLEATLPDGLCGQIIRDEIVPFLKAGQVANGVAAGARRIAAVVGGEGGAAIPASGGRARPVDWEQLVILGVIVAAIGFRWWMAPLWFVPAGRRRGGWSGGGFWGGGFSGGSFGGGGGGFGGFGGGFSGGGGASGSW